MPLFLLLVPLVPRSAHQTLDEMFRLQHPPALPLDFTHMGTLFAINAGNLDGRFTLNELYAFAEFCDARRKMYAQHEFVVQLQGQCTLRMQEHAMAFGGDAIEAWYVGVALRRCMYLFRCL
jgi:hypothetical protein